MATSYPSALDTLTNPISTDFQDTVDHAGQHTNANDAIEAIEAELGTVPKGSYASVIGGAPAAATVFAREVRGRRQSVKVNPEGLGVVVRG